MANLPCSSCQNTIDYRNAPNGNQPFPYTVTLDSSSILNPGEEERQRFCYRIETIGVNGTGFIPLDAFTLGVHSSLSVDDIASVSVTLNGVNQTVIWGENAALVSACTSGCAGLRLAFPMVNATDILYVCLTLNRAFGVGPIPVCLLSGSQLTGGLSICGPALSLVDACPTTAQQEVDVCIPITVTPYASVGEAIVTCCGDPVITSGTASCSGIPGGSCSFTVTQRVCVAVPVQFGASASNGRYLVNCGGAGEGACESCANGAGTANAAGYILNGAANDPSAAKAGRNASCGCRNQYPARQTQISDVLRWIDR